MGNKIFLEQNIEGRKERAPLGAACYLFNVIGAIGNILVLHVFRTRITVSSNYRIFVLFLSVVDMGTCIVHIVKESGRMTLVYNQVDTSGWGEYICRTSIYIGHAIGFASLCFIAFIAFERYKKICTPFKPQITVTQSKTVCVCTVLIGFLVYFPIFLYHGDRFVLVENINATRCAVENKYDGDLLPIIHLGLMFTAAAVGIFVTIVLLIKIQLALVKKAKSKQKMKYVGRTVDPESGRGTSNSGTPQKKSKQTENESRKSADDQDAERNRRVAVRFAIISMFLIISFISHTMFQFILATRRYFFPRQRISKLEDVILEYFPDIVAVNGILNPFVYLFTDTEFKQELRNMCWRKL
jgi:hypothetical protein